MESLEHFHFKVDGERRVVPEKADFVAAGKQIIADRMRKEL